MDWIQHYWWVIALIVVAVLAFVLLRPPQRVKLSDTAPLRPHMAQGHPRGLAGEVAAAASDVAGDIIEAPTYPGTAGGGPNDDLCRMKGVGPKLAEALNRLGFHRFEQLAALSRTEVARLDDQLGAFRGRIERDRIAEQADYLARNDTDGYEQKFGKL
jgi:predicted flap endonuclease-1-like 5' DNA nuclease